MHTAVFLDRDGVLISNIPYLSDPSKLELLPNVPDALRMLKKQGLLLVVVTNQSGIARGFFDEVRLRMIHSALRAKLREKGTDIDAIYYCPHLPNAPIHKYAISCDCRKPKPALLLQASRDYDIDLTRSYLVGDSERDILAGKAAGCITILIDSVNRDSQHKNSKKRPDFIVKSFHEATSLIISRNIKR